MDAVGFIHGVMNTDNMAVSGETIDYGPCAFMDSYDPATVFSSIDTGGRYAYGQQPLVAQWNLARFAETLIGLLDALNDPVDVLTERLQGFPQLYAEYWLSGMRNKLGLTTENEDDLELANDLLMQMKLQSVDYTLAFRRLSGAARGTPETFTALFSEPTEIAPWLDRWHKRTALEDSSNDERAEAMDRINPIYIPRNHKIEEALGAASIEGDLAPTEKMLAVLADPFEERDGLDDYAQPAPTDFADSFRTFCGT